jgi:hypothetical protein
MVVTQLMPTTAAAPTATAAATPAAIGFETALEIVSSHLEDDAAKLGAVMRTGPIGVHRMDPHQPVDRDPIPAGSPGYLLESAIKVVMAGLHPEGARTVCTNHAHSVVTMLTVLPMIIMPAVIVPAVLVLDDCTSREVQSALAVSEVHCEGGAVNPHCERGAV